MTEKEAMQCKVVLIGESGVGKTSIINRYISDTFSPVLTATPGASFATKTVFLKEYNQSIKFEIWDTAGQEKYKAITKNLFLKVMGAIIIYDITSEKSFTNLKSWVQMIKEECGSHMQIIMVGNKSDLIDQRKISEEEATNYAKEQKIEYIETSCKTGENVKKAVTILCESIMETKELGEDASFMLDSSTFIAPKKKKCC